MSNSKEPTWKDVKSVLINKEKSELIGLIKELYSFRRDNQTFMHSKFSLGRKSLEPYKKRIAKSLYPNVNSDQPVSLSEGRRAISDYFKATKNTLGQIELMVYYVEMGTKFTVNFGDMYEQFYDSLISMFERILTALYDQPADIRTKYSMRLKKIVQSAKNIGWGYFDSIDQLLNEYEAKIGNF